ncbi:MAG: LamG-like jellyroll fold domain-containing protein, partial [Gemmatimonadota bacterium]
LMFRFMPQYELSAEAPVFSSGSTPGAPVHAVGTETICLIVAAQCPAAQLAPAVFLRLGGDKFSYAIPHPVPYMEGLEVSGHAPVPSPAVWRHLFVVRRGLGLEIWLDGDHLCRQNLPAADCDASVGATAPHGLLRLGQRATGSNEKIAQFYGFIDDVAVFDHALTPAELSGWFQTGSGISDGATGLRTGINFDAALQAGGARIRSTATLTGTATVVPVGAQHASGIDAPHLPLISGTGPIELPFMGGQVWEVIQQFSGARLSRQRCRVLLGLRPRAGRPAARRTPGVWGPE